MCFDGFYLKWFNHIADKRATNLITSKLWWKSMYYKFNGKVLCRWI